MNEQANQAIAYTVEHGGGTFEAGTLLPFEPKDGYAVATGGVVVQEDAPVNVVSMLLVRVPEEYGTSFVGTWLEDGKLYIDGVRYIRDFTEALACAKATDQLAFYGFAEGVSFETKAYS